MLSRPKNAMNHGIPAAGSDHVRSRVGRKRRAARSVSPCRVGVPQRVPVAVEDRRVGQQPHCRRLFVAADRTHGLRVGGRQTRGRWRGGRRLPRGRGRPGSSPRYVDRASPPPAAPPTAGAARLTPAPTRRRTAASLRRSVADSIAGSGSSMPSSLCGAVIVMPSAMAASSKQPCHFARGSSVSS